MVPYDLIIIIPPHQRASQQPLMRRLLLRQMLPSFNTFLRSTSDRPFPRRETFVAVDGATCYLHVIMILLKDFVEGLFGVVLFEAFVSESCVECG